MSTNNKQIMIKFVTVASILIGEYYDYHLCHFKGSHQIATTCHKEDIDCSSYAKETIHKMDFQHESEHNKIAMTCDKSETYV